MMMERIADWHGEQACVYYQKYMYTERDDDLRSYCRHALIADRLWNRLRDEKYAARNAR